ncbi:hypothetical protein HWV62_30911 [Athelia sp. TMB]|nr:hypothetical protein HWV62_30911 [Athelia sp. TMB]
MDQNNPPLNPLEHHQALDRFPRANYWVRAPGHAYHPDMHPQQFQQQRQEAAQAANAFRAAQHYRARGPGGPHPPPAYHAGPYAPPPGPPPVQQGLPAADGQDNNHDWRRPMTRLKVSFERNSNTAGAIVTRDTFEVPLDISHEDFWARLCANFDAPPEDAQLGYKYHDDKRRTPWHKLGTPEQTAIAFQRGQALHIARRTPRDIVMEVHNLSPARDLPPGRAPRGAKRTYDDSENDPDLSTMVSADKILAILKERTFCSTHKKWCWLNPFSGEHITLDVFDLTLWAKKILIGEATIARPPNTLNFDHVRKKTRYSSSSSIPPPIHVNIHNHGMPLSDFGGQQMINTSSAVTSASYGPTTSATSQDLSFAPEAPSSPLEDLPSSNLSTLGHDVTLRIVLEDLDAALPDANLITFAEPLAAVGITLAADLMGVGDELLTGVVGIPADAVEIIRDHAKYLTTSL